MFLTNTLEPVEPQGDLMLPALAEEVKSAQAVKDKPILVITGNPPYNRFSKNKGAEIMRLIETYKYVNGRHFEERKHWLGDDYVKFFRFAQKKIEKEERGIVAVVTNHAFLENPTFRGMRASLLGSFDQLLLLNLHGNSRRRERQPDGSPDSNVFDIEQGVSVTLLIKAPGVERGVWYADMWGNRLAKYKKLAESNVTIISEELSPKAPMYFFSPHVPADFERWSEIWSIEEIFGFSSVGMLTARDRLNIAFSDSEALSRADEFVSLSSEEARRKFELGDDSRDWTVAGAQADLSGLSNRASAIRSVLYRPFDTRRTIYTGQSRGAIGQPARPLQRCMDVARNVALVTTNRVEVGEFRHAFATDLLADGHAVAAKETNHVYPLYYSDGENINPKFRTWLSDKYQYTLSPEEIFGYIYAVTNSSEYRSRYADFLLVDAPRVPFAETRKQFERLSGLGWALVQAHLLKAVPRSTPRLGDYVGRGDHTVEAVRYSPQEQTIWINKTQGFAPVPDDVWSFHIGGYQVLDKYLKSRKGRTLNLDEQTHVGEVAEALAFTIRQMEAIDEAYLVAFPETAAEPAPGSTAAPEPVDA